MFSWLLHYLYSFLGIAHKSGRVLFVGLDFAGKTTLLNLLKSGKFSASPPTGQGTAQEITINTGGSEKETLKLTSIDLGGHKQARRVWKDYFFGVDAVIFLVDATDRKRLPEARYELAGVLSDPTLLEGNVPVAVLANKIDRENAMGESELTYGLDLFEKRTGKSKDDSRLREHGGKLSRPVELFTCSLLRRQGYGEAFRWIAQFMD